MSFEEPHAPGSGKAIFSGADYAVFALMLAISAGIGVFYGVKDRRSSSSQNFLMGGRSLGVVPVSMSLLASFMSAITLLGTPSEVYIFGTSYFIINLSFILVVPATAYLYLPSFHDTNITSAYEYLELRFHRTIRTIGSVVFFIHMMMYMPIVLYAPALALSEVTGLSILFSVLSVGLVCTFYTSIGGMKAVVWTDLFQALIMYAAMFAVVIKGSLDLGGIETVWEISKNGSRIEFLDFNPNPTVRHTFWSLVFGGYFTWMGNYAANQAMVQRYLSISTLRGAQIAIWINLPALVLLITLTGLAGLVIYAYYSKCDPLSTKIVQAPDQLFPRYVMETLGFLPGLPGLFVSGIFSGALSTVSSGVNSLAAVSLEDFIKTYIKKDISEVSATRVTKLLAMAYGLAAIALVFVAKLLGGVLQAALTIHGIVGGPMLGLFTLGMFFPWSNTIGAGVGIFSGFVVAFWLGMGAFVKKPYNPKAPVSVDGCRELYFNVTGKYNLTTVVPTEQTFILYRLSYLWFSAVGCIACVVIGLVVSCITGPRKMEDIDPRLISPVTKKIYRWLNRNKGKKVMIDVPNIDSDLKAKPVPTNEPQQPDIEDENFELRERKLSKNGQKALQ